MGTWTEFNIEHRPEPPHEHEVPDLGGVNHGNAPGQGSVWKCSCGETFRVIKQYAAGKSTAINSIAEWLFCESRYWLIPSRDYKV